MYVNLCREKQLYEKKDFIRTCSDFLPIFSKQRLVIYRPHWWDAAQWFHVTDGRINISRGITPSLGKTPHGVFSFNHSPYVFYLLNWLYFPVSRFFFSSPTDPSAEACAIWWRFRARSDKTLMSRVFRIKRRAYMNCVLICGSRYPGSRANLRMWRYRRFWERRKKRKWWDIVALYINYASCCSFITILLRFCDR